MHMTIEHKVPIKNLPIRLLKCVSIHIEWLTDGHLIWYLQAQSICRIN